jgi:hypothetical protein
LKVLQDEGNHVHIDMETPFRALNAQIKPMMSAHNWIDVRFGEKHELSPILLEHRPAYSVFDCQAF